MPSPTLLSFVSYRDPYYSDGMDDGRQKGPLFTLLDERKFERLILFSRPHRHEQLARSRQALRELYPQLPVEVVELELSDSTYHPHILAALREALSKIRRARPDDDYAVSLLSGNSEIHACWVLLAVSGEFSGRLLNFRRSVHNGLAGPRLVRELDWSDPLAAIKPETLSLLSARRDRWDDADQQGPATNTPRHYFVRRSLEQAVHLSRHIAPVLIRGGPGTQKQTMAALIHQLGNRQAGPLLIFNCAALPEHLIEAALFGEETTYAEGKLRQADGGTLVLIKIQHVPAPVLARLFAAIHASGFFGGSNVHPPIKLNVRLICTTDRDLEAEVRLGHFPAEIWQQLQPSTIRLPPLRERPGDITLLAREELERLNRTLPRPKRLSNGALAKLESHAWPSNVSELRRVIEQAAVNAEQAAIQPDDVDLDLSVNLANVFAINPPRIRKGFSLEHYLRSIKHELVRGTLRKTRGNQSQAARLLGVSPQAISKLLKNLKSET